MSWAWVGGFMAVAALSAAGSMVSQGIDAADAADKQLDLQRRAQQAAKENALKQEKLSEQALNQANQQMPDAGALLRAADSGKWGTSTMLTGPAGIDVSRLVLGKKTLLGE